MTLEADLLRSDQPFVLRQPRPDLADDVAFLEVRRAHPDLRIETDQELRPRRPLHCSFASCKRRRRRVVERTRASPVQLHKDGDRILAEYPLALQNGSVDGRPQPEGSSLLSFEGMDEMTEVHGAGTARVEDDRLVFTLMHHQGADYTYEGSRRS